MLLFWKIFFFFAYMWRARQWARLWLQPARDVFATLFQTFRNPRTTISPPVPPKIKCGPHASNILISCAMGGRAPRRFGLFTTNIYNFTHVEGIIMPSSYLYIGSPDLERLIWVGDRCTRWMLSFLMCKDAISITASSFFYLKRVFPNYFNKS